MSVYSKLLVDASTEPMPPHRVTQWLEASVKKQPPSVEFANKHYPPPKGWIWLCVCNRVVLTTIKPKRRQAYI